MLANKLMGSASYVDIDVGVTLWLSAYMPDSIVVVQIKFTLMLLVSKDFDFMGEIVI